MNDDIFGQLRNVRNALLPFLKDGVTITAQQRKSDESDASYDAIVLKHGDKTLYVFTEADTDSSFLTASDSDTLPNDYVRTLK